MASVEPAQRGKQPLTAVKRPNLPSLPAKVPVAGVSSASVTPQKAIERRPPNLPSVRPPARQTTPNLPSVKEVTPAQPSALPALARTVRGDGPQSLPTKEFVRSVTELSSNPALRHQPPPSPPTLPSVRPSPSQTPVAPPSLRPPLPTKPDAQPTVTGQPKGRAWNGPDAPTRVSDLY